MGVKGIPWGAIRDHCESVSLSVSLSLNLSVLELPAQLKINFGLNGEMPLFKIVIQPIQLNYHVMGPLVQR